MYHAVWPMLLFSYVEEEEREMERKCSQGDNRDGRGFNDMR